VGNAAVIVKLFRVLLLFPVVVSIGWCFARPRPALDAVKASVPVFALVFIALCVINSLASSVAAIAPIYGVIKGTLVEAANWGLLIAIAALGLGTSFRAVAALGWRYIATVVATTLVILSVAMPCVMLLH
jgi:uncharacterized membrane protein YadS